MAEKLFHIGVKAMIENQQGQLLLFEENVNHTHSLPTTPYWDFAGGRIDEDDADVLATLAREIQEETGITEIASATFFSSVISNHKIKLSDGKIIGLALMIYRVKLKPNAKFIILSDEHVRYEWVDRKDAKQRLSHKYPVEFTELL